MIRGGVKRKSNFVFFDALYNQIGNTVSTFKPSAEKYAKPLHGAFLAP